MPTGATAWSIPRRMLHCRQVWPGDEEPAGIDIFLLHDQGRVIEHWDLLQAIPTVSANDNGVV